MNYKYLIPLFSILLVFSCTSEKQQQKDKTTSQQKQYVFSQQPLTEQKLPSGASYADYLQFHSDGPEIPGLYQGAVPQGMAYDSQNERMFISNYMFNGKPSSISIVSMKNGKFIKVIWLLNSDGTAHKGHVGGLAVSKKHLWIASGKGVYRVTLASIDTTLNNGQLTMSALIATPVRGSFATYSDGILWVGEFTSKDGSYSTPDSHHIILPSKKINHAWMAGYILNRETDRIQSKLIIRGEIYPDRIISIPDEVQGAAFFKNILLVSLSYGRRNKSHLVSYKNPLSGEQQKLFVIQNSSTIPLSVLDGTNKINSLTAPPMTEGIVNYKNSLAVVFESGSDKYRSTSLYPQGRIQILPINIFRQ